VGNGLLLPTIPLFIIKGNHKGLPLHTIRKMTNKKSVNYPLIPLINPRLHLGLFTFNPFGVVHFNNYPFIALIHCILISLTFILVPAALAESTESVDPKKAKDYINDILSQPAFKTSRQESHWRYIGDDASESEKQEEVEETFSSSSYMITFIAQLFELLLWILLGVGLLFLIIYGIRWFKPLQPQQTTQLQEYTATPHRLDQIETKAVLPKDIAQQASILWQSGEASAALSLLYRGALSVLTTRDGLMIDDSATENECLHLVKSKQPIELSTYFSGLTRAWQKLAYAQRIPSEAEAQQLCNEWPHYFQ